MSSILTNTSAMVALQTLKSINKNLGDVQGQISTGKAIGTAKDNSAIWAISKVMESDVQGFKAISSSLSLGESSVSVARQASESVTELLTQMKDKIVASQGQNVDRTKLQADIDAISGQIESVVGAAQFNGLNLVNGSTTGTNVLASLDRDANGSVTSSSIAVGANNLSTSAGDPLTAAAANVGTDTGTAGVIDGGGTNNTIALDTFAFQGGGAALSKDNVGAVPGTLTALIEGDRIALTINNIEGEYTVREGDTADSIVTAIKSSLEQGGLDTTSTTLALTAGTLTVTNTTNADIAFSFEATRGTGGLSDLSTLSVANDADAATALTNIESMINTSIDAAASFGSVQGRIETQMDFVSGLTDALKTGIGALVDANMEEASARLQALQVQQQLGTQSLSIANQAPQSILSLFR